MYKELKKFKISGSFNFTPTDSLEEVCNATQTGSGVFLVYDASKEESELVMIASTGTAQNDGTLKIKKWRPL